MPTRTSGVMTAPAVRGAPARAASGRVSAEVSRDTCAENRAVRHAPEWQEVSIDTKTLHSILDKVRVVNDPCDLDLLLFFYRHPRALLTGEQLVVHLGYGQDRIAASMNALIGAGLLTRLQSRSKNAHLYVLEIKGPQGALLPDLLTYGLTCEGRDRVKRLLNRARRADVMPDDATPSQYGIA